MRTLHDILPEAMGEPTVVNTTLYDLVAAMNAAVEPGEEDVVVSAMLALLQAGRIRFLGDVSVFNELQEARCPSQATSEGAKGPHTWN